MDIGELMALGDDVGDLLIGRGETVGVAEGACGGLVSAALLARPGASDYFVGGAVVYTRAAGKAFMAGAVDTPPGLRGASEPWVRYLAESVAVQLGTTWGVGEGGAAGPTGNPYGDPAGHAWVGVHGPRSATRHVLTGESDRRGNMVAFAVAALELLRESIV